MRNAARRNALLALVLLSLIWSYNWIVMKQVLRWSGPFDFAAWRYALGTVVLFVALWLRGESLRPPP
jgi:drug/metabolite transporter (DMT)-like permease